MIDRTTKALLFAIAVGLWAQLAMAFLEPAPLQAQNIMREMENDTRMKNIESHLFSISLDTKDMRASLKGIEASAALR